ncbi:MAG: isoprenylcysteine carboxylmethyltransferase family protein [Candidatus Neomarinimicrobiota bacterium]
MSGYGFIIRIIGAGPIGLAANICLWTVFFFLEKALRVPPITIHPALRLILLVLFITDAAYLIGYGLYLQRKNRSEKKLLTHGPYLFVRHPLYSALIYSATGILALWLYSWGLIVAVVPIAVAWSWLVRKEEYYLLDTYGEKYRRYCETTGQFLPSFKNINEKFS